MKKIKNALSLCDGISGLQLALKRAGIGYGKYYSSEVDQNAIAITQKRFPKTIQVGDMTKLKAEDFKNIDIISAGSPCTQFSLAGKMEGAITEDGKLVTSLKLYLKYKKAGKKFIGQSYLVFEFIRLVKEIKPKYFLLENVKMSKLWADIITKELGVQPIKINSSLMSAQNRMRWYWTNLPGVTIPTDKQIKLWDVIENAVAGYGKRGQDLGKKKSDGKIKWEQVGTTRKDNKANCVTTKRGNTAKIRLFDGSVRDITIEEAENLQTLPKNYTKVKGVSETNRYKAIGNGWTISVISHLLKGLKK